MNTVAPPHGGVAMLREHIFARFRTCDLLAQMSVGSRPLLHEHEVAVQLTTQPGSCSPPPGTHRSGATIS